jgi:uncharacterized protein (TIGR02145 family)
MKKTILYAAAAIGAVVAAVIVGCGAEQQYAATSYNTATSYNAAAPDTAATPDTATPYVPVSTVNVVSVGTGASGGGVYPAGATVTISAGTLANIHQFKEWTTESDGVIFADAESSTTTFTMPANGVTVRANFQQNSGSCESVVIGGNTWMVKNLNIETSDSWCYDNNPDSCKKYGRLYDWETAMTVCPPGWRLPTKDEWKALVIAAGGIFRGGALKATSGWSDDGNGTDDFGFSALPGGILHYYGTPHQYQSPPANFQYGGFMGFWWTATVAYTAAYGGYYPYYAHIEYYLGNVDVGAGGYFSSQNVALSVRCVKDIR